MRFLPLFLRSLLFSRFLPLFLPFLLLSCSLPSLLPKSFSATRIEGLALAHDHSSMPSSPVGAVYRLGDVAIKVESCQSTLHSRSGSWSRMLACIRSMRHSKGMSDPIRPHSVDESVPFFLREASKAFILVHTIFAAGVRPTCLSNTWL